MSYSNDKKPSQKQETWATMGETWAGVLETWAALGVNSWTPSALPGASSYSNDTVGSGSYTNEAK